MIKRALLMAAGLGTRLRPFTDKQPKAFLPLLGVPMAQFALDALSAAGVEQVVVNIHHHPDKARNSLEKLDLGTMRVQISDESPLLLGSAGGPKKAQEFFGDRPFFMVNADVVSDVDLASLAMQHERLRMRWGVKLTLAVFERVENETFYPEIVFDRKKSLMKSRGEPSLGRPVFIGAAVYESTALDSVPVDRPTDFVTSILNPALAEGKVGIFLTRGMWFDVGSPELYLQAHLRLMERLEVGNLEPLIRKRLEATNKRLGSGIWVGPHNIRLPAEAQWSPPVYWNAEGATKAPVNLGPSQVIYSDEPNSRSSGISYGGLFVSCGTAGPARSG